MYKRTLIVSLFLVLVFFYKLDAQEKERSSVSAQKSEMDDVEQTKVPIGKVISISPHVGPVIDESEREKYNLFTDVIGFQTALIIEQANGRMMLRINYKDELADAMKYLSRLGDPYEAIVYDREGRAAIDWGVYGTPETFVVDRKGIIRYKQVGPISERILRDDLLPLIARLNQE